MKHYRTGFSSLGRYLSCPASWHREGERGVESKTTDCSARGTILHEAVAAVLAGLDDEICYYGLTPADASAVKSLADQAREIIGYSGYHSERTLAPIGWMKGYNLGGTPDLIVYRPPADRPAEVVNIDFKLGDLPVSAEDNWQLTAGSLSWCYHHDIDIEACTHRHHILQPCGSSSAVYTGVEMAGREALLKERMRDIASGPAVPAPSMITCMFCRNKCEDAWKRKPSVSGSEIVGMLTADDHDGVPAVGVQALLSAVEKGGMEALSTADIDRLASGMSKVKSAISILDKEVRRRLDAGETLESAVYADGRREWTDDPAAETFLKNAGLKRSEYTVTKVISPSAAVKMLGEFSGRRATRYEQITTPTKTLRYKK